MDTRSYYNDFANWYDRERSDGYHKMLDDSELTAIRRYGTGKDVLEAGCGTGLLLERTAQFAKSAVGIDLSEGMLAKARERGLEVQGGSITDLPYENDSFDLVYCVKVLPHVEDIEGALSEMARVTRPGGYVLAEFYNSLSLRYLIKAFKQPTAISATTNDAAVYTRYDPPKQIRRYLPADLVWESTRGIRIVTPISLVHKVPGLGQGVRAVENVLADIPVARNLGGFLLTILRKQ